MARSQTRTATRGRRGAAAGAGLSRAAITAAAVGIADAEGIDAVTIRRVAESLHVSPMALYWHYDGKDELFESMGDGILDGLALPDPASSWDRDLAAALTAFSDVLRPHPEVARLAAARVLDHPRGLALSDHVLRALEAAELPDASIAWLGSMAFNVVMAAVTGEPNAPATAEGVLAADARRTALEAIDEHEYPAVARHRALLAFCDEPDAYFRLVIEHFVGGVRFMAASPAR